MSVYFAVADALNVVKVGFSTMPTKRLHTLQAWSPVPLVLAAVDERGDPMTEAEVLQRFAADRLRGEWVTLTAAMRAVIRETAETGSIPGGWYAPAGHVRYGLGTCTVCGPRPQQVEMGLGVSVAQQRADLGVATVQSAQWMGYTAVAIPRLLAYLRGRGNDLTLAGLFDLKRIDAPPQRPKRKADRDAWEAKYGAARIPDVPARHPDAPASAEKVAAE